MNQLQNLPTLSPCFSGLVGSRLQVISGRLLGLIPAPLRLRVATFSTALSNITGYTDVTLVQSVENMFSVIWNVYCRLTFIFGQCIPVVFIVIRVQCMCVCVCVCVCIYIYIYGLTQLKQSSLIIILK
jgi:hypothetical protein